METVMLQFKHLGPAPSPTDVCRLFNLGADELDTDFGVIATDPAAGLYTVLVAGGAADRVQAALAARPQEPAEGIFANPRVEPFGPPQG